MPEEYVLGAGRVRVYDLSDTLDNATAAFEPNPHGIEYVDHRQSVAMAEQMGIESELWPDGLGWAVERVTLSTHSGTHVDAPYHYGPVSGGEPARTIENVPLRWCYSDGVLLDMTHKDRREGIAAEDVEGELERIGYRLKPYDIVLVRTDTWRRFREPGYDRRHAGLRASATRCLVERGVRLIGIDAWGIDRAFDVLREDALRGEAIFWESHIYGREREYSQIERLAHLDELPRPFGFRVAAFPVRLAAASAGWARVVAIFEEPA